MLADAHPPEDHRLILRWRKSRATVPAGFPHRDATDISAIFSGAKSARCAFSGFPILGIGVDILLIVKAFFYNRMHDRVQHTDIGTGAELQHMSCEPAQPHARAGPSRSAYRRVLVNCLKYVAATGWFSIGLQPMAIATSAFSISLNVAVTAPEPDVLDQRRHRGLAWQSRVQWSTLL